MAGLNSISAGWLGRQMAKVLVLLLIAPLARASAVPQVSSAQSAVDQQQTTAANSSPAQPALPDAPQSHSQSQTAPEQTQTHVPVGTAAAPAESPVGTAVSRPAGAAIAPAKQKRRRTFVIRMGLVIGAAVAIGTVVGLSKASRSRP